MTADELLEVRAWIEGDHIDLPRRKPLAKNHPARRLLEALEALEALIDACPDEGHSPSSRGFIKGCAICEALEGLV